MALNPTTLINQALALAQQGASKHELPVAAILVNAQGEVIAQAHNLVETQQNPLAHAEMLVLQQAAAQGHKYLQECTIAVTLEPCPMCAAALCHARIGTIIFGAYDAKSGGTTNGPQVPQHMHHKPKILGGIEEQACRQQLQTFFQSLRS
ncbi:MAG: nucleoside deaminase [Proteobacteria bacterium]|nr:nucleoside deaminase [Pseudomonadota bacterium]NBX86135.1 nucleoside deaminase [Pseudomonadota bacterium]